ncbi:hypothetical protein BDR04DRAFT_1157396 [Suillus decipiens]|nr:hypothetical protein BDR04DRAFT_1157396 [Suillus decipiens]
MSAIPDLLSIFLNLCFAQPLQYPVHFSSYPFWHSSPYYNPSETSFHSSDHLQPDPIHHIIRILRSSILYTFCYLMSSTIPTSGVPPHYDPDARTFSTSGSHVNSSASL